MGRACTQLAQRPNAAERFGAKGAGDIQSGASVGLWRGGRIGGRRRRRGRIGLAKKRIVQGDIHFDFFGSDSLRLVGAERVGFDQERILQAVDLAEFVEESLPGDVLTGDFAGAFPFEQERRGGIEIEKADVAEFVGELDLESRLAEYFFLVDEFDLIPLFLVLDERAVEIGFVKDVAEIGFGHGLDGGARREGIVGPAGGFSVVRANQGLPIEGDFHVQLQWPHALDDEGAVGAGAEGDGAGDALGLHGFDFLNAASRRDVVGDDLVNGLRRERRGEEATNSYEEEFADHR